MRWLLKASLQKALGSIPRGDSLNYLAQRHIARSLPRGEAAFRRKFKRAQNHFHAFVAHGSIPPEEALFYEFGVGWDLVVALSYRALGVDRQVLVDIRPGVRVDLVNDTLEKFARLKAELAVEAPRQLRPLGPASLKSLDELPGRFGIEYLAPRDPRSTGLPAASVDFVSSTVTLEHVPMHDLDGLLAECLRLLKPDGVMSCSIDLKDHFSYFDRSLSPYNFLRFDDRAWRLLTSPLNYQNRLRYPDYVALFRRAGFEIVTQKVVRPSPADVEMLRRLPLAQPFRDHYSLEDVGAKLLRIVVRPALPDAH